MTVGVENRLASSTVSFGVSVALGGRVTVRVGLGVHVCEGTLVGEGVGV